MVVKISRSCTHGWTARVATSLLVVTLGMTNPVVATSRDAIPVTTQKLADLVFFPEQTAPATVVTLNNARVSAEINGQLEDILAKVGDQVAKDKIVAKIDCRDPEVDLAQAKATYDAAQARNNYDHSQLTKARKLSASKSISSEEMDKRRAAALVSSADTEKAEASIEKAQLAVERCDLKAPFNAVVVARLASVGDFVGRGTAVLQLVDTDSTEVSARIQEIDLGSIKTAKAMYFDSQNESYRVDLRTIVPMMESRLRSYETRLTFVGKRTAPGSAGRLRWISPQPHIPADLLVRRDQLGVFLVDEGKARFLALPQAHEGKPAPIPDGLQGDVVVDGRFNLTDGDPVHIKQL